MFAARLGTRTRSFAQSFRSGVPYVRSHASVSPTKEGEAMSSDQTTATIESAPAAGQTIHHNGATYTTIKEGLAYILVPPKAKTVTDPKSTKQESIEKAQNVFYNPIQQFNRDLSVLAIRAFAEDFAEKRRHRAESRSDYLRGKKHRKQAKKSEPESTTSGEPSVSGTKRKASEAIDDAIDTKKQKTDTAEGTDAAAPKTHQISGPAPNEAPNGTSTTAADLAALPHQHASAPTGSRPNDNARKTLRILDALSATGLRALRYASELPLPTFVVANDLLASATTMIKFNVAHNKLGDKIHAVTSNAQAHMYTAAFAAAGHTYGKYDVIDLDPYGTAVPFLEAALLAVNNDGLLCVTCTDAGVFNSMGYLEKTFALYGGLPIKGLHAHEAGLRLILHSIATTAARHGLAVEPLLSLSIDFYARVFVRVKKSPVEVKFLAAKSMVVHGCDGGCGAWSVQRLARASGETGKDGTEFHKFHPAVTTADQRCEFCGYKTHLAGPMWGGPLHNPWFVSRVLDLLPNVDGETYATKDRIEGMLVSALDELEVVTELDQMASAKMGTCKGTDRKEANEHNGGAEVGNGKVSSGEKTAEKEPTLAQQDEELGDVRGSPTMSQAIANGETAKCAKDTTESNGKARTQSNSQAAQNGVKSSVHAIPEVPASIIDHHPFYVNVGHLSKVMKCRAPPEAAVKGALRRLGYIATRSHAKPGMIKTQAPWTVIWEVMREWIRQKAPVKEGSLKESSPGYKILYGDNKETEERPDLQTSMLDEAELNGGMDLDAADGRSDGHKDDGAGNAEESGSSDPQVSGSRLKIVFDEVMGKDRPGKRLKRYQENPRAHWGPMSRARG